MNGSNFEPSQFQMHMLARDIVSIDDFLSHLNIPPVALSRLSEIEFDFCAMGLEQLIPESLESANT